MLLCHGLHVITSYKGGMTFVENSLTHLPDNLMISMPVSVLQGSYNNLIFFIPRNKTTFGYMSSCVAVPTLWN